MVVLRIAGADQRISCGQGTWVKGSMTSTAGENVPVAASGAWSSDDTYSFTLFRCRTPFSTAYDLRFGPEGVVIDALDHVGLTSPTRERLVGALQP